jgi:Domain of unknown function DUF29
MNAPFDRRDASPDSPRATYKDDLHAWAREQAALLRAGRLAEADAANIAEELDGVASRQYDKLESALRALLAHMLKWDHRPEWRGRICANTLRVQRLQVAKVLRKNTSLKSSLDEAIAEAWEEACIDASGDTDLPLDTFPEVLPYDWQAMMERPLLFDPPAPARRGH